MIISWVYRLEPSSSGRNASSNTVWVGEDVPASWEQLNYHSSVLVRNPLRNQFIHYYIYSRGVYGTFHIKLIHFKQIYRYIYQCVRHFSISDTSRCRLREYLAIAYCINFCVFGWYKSNETIWASFYWHGLTLTRAGISNYIHYKVWGEITNPFLHFDGSTVEVWEWISNFIPHFTGHVITYPCWD